MKGNVVNHHIEKKTLIKKMLKISMQSEQWSIYKFLAKLGFMFLKNLSPFIDKFYL